jgi:hypothetical protein
MTFLNTLKNSLDLFASTLTKSFVRLHEYNIRSCLIMLSSYQEGKLGIGI